MKPSDIASLLWIKQARERRSAAVLSRARSAEQQAAEAHAAAERALAAHTLQRRAVEAEIYGGLLGAGPVPVRSMQAAMARLAQGAGLGTILAGHSHALFDLHTTRTEAMRRAQAAQLRAARRVQAWDQLSDQASEAERTGEAQRYEAELDEAAERRVPGSAAWLR